MTEEDLDAIAAPGFDAGRFREVLGHFASGVTIVTAPGAEGQSPVGFTAQSFTSVSLDPPLVAICPNLASRTWPAIEAAGSFCVNVLADDQEAMCRTFASKDGDRFAGVGWTAGAVGAPRLTGALAWIDCTLEAVHPGGDHLIVVGRVVDLDLGDRTAEPLLFYRGGFGRFVP